MEPSAAPTSCGLPVRWPDVTTRECGCLLSVTPQPASQGGSAGSDRFYNIEMMLGAATRCGGEISVCGSCMDARGITDGELVEGCHRSSLHELTDGYRGPTVS